VRRLDRDDRLNAGGGAVTRAIAVENKWRAQRYGVHGRFIDEKRRAAVEVATVLDETIALVSDDAEALGCRAEIERLRALAAGDTSADRQLAIWREARARKASRAAALAEVVDWLARATIDARLPDAANPIRAWPRDRRRDRAGALGASFTSRRSRGAVDLRPRCAGPVTRPM
jgi:carboxylate-amine ligase